MFNWLRRCFTTVVIKEVEVRVEVPLPYSPEYLNKHGQIQWKLFPELRQNMYTLLKEKTGVYAVDKVNGKPKGSTTKEYYEVLKEITVEIGLPIEKHKAIANQIAWACIPVCSKESMQSSYNNNKAAAILAGYMTFDDATKLIEQNKEMHKNDNSAKEH